MFHKYVANCWREKILGFQTSKADTFVIKATPVWDSYVANHWREKILGFQPSKADTFVVKATPVWDSL
jgi:hypothetical protein